MKLWSSNYKLKIGIINNINNIYIHSYKFYIAILGFSLVQLPVVSDSLRPHEPQHARPPCPSPAPRVHPNSCPSGQWCHPAISSSVFPFSSCPQSFPSSGSFPMSQLFAWDGQSIGVSASASILPMNTQDTHIYIYIYIYIYIIYNILWYSIYYYIIMHNILYIYIIYMYI